MGLALGIGMACGAQSTTIDSQSVSITMKGLEDNGE
jgi:hypothetical protein